MYPQHLLANKRNRMEMKLRKFAHISDSELEMEPSVYILIFQMQHVTLACHNNFARKAIHRITEEFNHRSFTSPQGIVYLKLIYETHGVQYHLGR